MIVKPTINRSEIEAVLNHPDIYDTITDDSNEGGEQLPINDGDYTYVGGYVNNEIIAVMLYHSYRDGKACHVQVLPDFRKEYALQFGEQSLEFKGTQPLYAEIPSLYKNVLDFALHFGFEIIETEKRDYCKNGELYDINILRFKDGRIIRRIK